MKQQQLKGSLLLLLTAMIWGIAFVAQKEGVSRIGPFTMQATRFFLAGTVLLPFALAGRKRQAALREQSGLSRGGVLLRGFLCGLLLCAASTFQQFGLLYTSVGKSGFITTLYIVLVPLAGIFLGKKVGGRVWASVVIAVAGLYFLCMHGTMSVNAGDLLTLVSAFFFMAQILYIDHIGACMDGILLACIQSYTCCVIGAIGMLIFETPSWSAILSCWLPICYAGILSGGVAYTLQILGQRYTEPTLASLLMSLESVFAALGGWLILHQTLAPRELLGCALMFAAIILAQLSGKAKQTA